jgi:PhnB protein
VQVHPYLIFDGQCREAFSLYQQLLGGTIEMMQTHGESPIAADVPPAWHDRILHARLNLGDAILMGSDSPPDQYARPQGVYVSLQVDDPADAERLYRALEVGGTVIMPFGTTFWAAGGFGMLIDRFGTPWMINCDRAA